MNEIIGRIFHFEKQEFPNRSALYGQLANEGQSPKALMISCADSRVVPEHIVQAQPGDLFVCRNAGNIVPPFATQNGVPASAVRLTKRSGIDMATFKTATTVDGTNTANEEWVFSIGGATWQLECQSTPDQGDEVRKACDTALDSIKAK